jgi:hypothetical protein
MPPSVRHLRAVLLERHLEVVPFRLVLELAQYLID